MNTRVRGTAGLSPTRASGGGRFALGLLGVACVASCQLIGGFQSFESGAGGATASSSSNGSSGGGGSGGGAGGHGGSGGGFVETGPITGHAVVKQLDDKGNPEAHQYVDFSAGSAVVLEALFQQPNGAWVTVSGIGAQGSDPQGNFSIPAKIDGPYVLHFDPKTPCDGGFCSGAVWAVMENRDQVDLDIYVVRDFSVPTLSAGNDPQARYEISPIKPWQAGDVLEFLQPETGVYSFVADGSVFSPPIMVGAQSIMDSVAGYRELTQDDHIIDSTLPVHVFHLSRYGTDVYQSIAGYAKVNFTVPDAPAPATFDITSTDFQIQDHTKFERHVIIHDDKFDALAKAFNPAAKLGQTTLNFSLQPVPYDVAGQIVGTADLATSDPIPATQHGDINIDFFFADPFPTTWQLAADFRKNATIHVQAAGQVSSPVTFTNANCLIIDKDPLLDTGTPLDPQVFPVTAAKVDGATFFGTGGPLATATPTLSWTAPMGPAPAEIQVQALPVVSDGSTGSTVTSFGETAPIIALKGSATSVTLPTGFLAASTQYVFVVTSFYSPHADHESAPTRIPATLCAAQTISSQFTTP